MVRGWSKFRADSTFRREAEPGRHLELVVSGLLRIYLMAPDGRTLTIRYCRAGSVMGAVSLFSVDYVMPGFIQALVASRLLVLRPDVVAELARVEAAVGLALNAELSERLRAFVAEIRDSAFATVRQRVARHLLDLASEGQPGRALVARTTQQALAEAVGSVREVVVRVLHDLRHEGIVATGRQSIVILSPERLLGESYRATGAASSAPVLDRNLGR